MHIFFAQRKKRGSGEIRLCPFLFFLSLYQIQISSQAGKERKEGGNPFKTNKKGGKEEKKGEGLVAMLIFGGPNAT